MGKLAKINAEEEYRKMMGDEALERQKRLYNVEHQKCSCTPRPLKRKWGDTGQITTRSVHDKDCAKFKEWMDNESVQE